MVHDIFVHAFVNAVRPAYAAVFAVLLIAAVCAGFMARLRRGAGTADAEPAWRKLAAGESMNDRMSTMESSPVTAAIAVTP